MKTDLNPKEISDLEKARDGTVSNWIELFQNDSLTYLQLYGHWAFWVPKAFSPLRALNAYEPLLNEDVLDTVLIRTIEAFIFDDNEDLQKSFNEVCKLKSVCGTIFKGGDPFYSCRDCGTDSTCVLCASCFMVSEHKNHNYKIGTSAGGGCCDCGDVLSWKSDPHCAEHIRGIENASSISFSQDLMSRAELVTSAILQYCFEISMLKPSSSLPTIFTLRDNEDILGVDIDDYHCLVLYNDESHSFEQVANSLTSVTKCSSIEAYTLATYVDKEGRAILKYSTYSKCYELKNNLDRFTSLHNIQPLKLHILDWQLVTHQMFSFKLLSWLENFMKQTKQFRDLVTSISLNLCSHRKDICLIFGSQKSLVEEVLLHDSALWKSARVRWYHLFLSVMLVDHSNKIAFAEVFTSNYGAIVKNFIQDDHEHVFSVASLSVQIYTVPSIAHYLIASKDAMSIMLHTFYLECTKVCNGAGKLEFSHASSQAYFFRSFCVLHDLRYLLNSPPEEWDSDLRRSFMSGISILLDIFLLMQDMCGNKRQIGQHMEFESEWKQEFKLQIKLTPVISHVLNWCSTDQIIAIKTYRLVLKKIVDYYNPKFSDNSWSNVTLAGHSVTTYNYIGSSEPISLHLPLSRFLGGLYLHLIKFGFHYTSPELSGLIKPTPLQLIEPILRTQVMIGQVHAGMWRRNGQSLPNQILYYQSPKCRAEMLDKDIVLLQIGASLIESNQFILNLLYKFHLMYWARPEFETLAVFDDSLKQVISLSEEFLSLLITIIGERYHPAIGEVTAEECLQNEIIHRLFIKPCLHSELYSFLPDSDCFKTEMENIIGKIATFQKANNSQKGVYLVKKELSSKYNVFFYHYTKEERSMSEEEQRGTGQDLCLPPSLPRFRSPFETIPCLLHSDVLLHIIRTVLVRSLSSSGTCFSENQLHRVLFLIGFALQEDECFCKVKFTCEADKWDLKPLLQKLLECKNAQIYTNLIKWLLRRYRSFTTGLEDDSKKETGETSVCIQKEINRNKLIAERQAAIMAQMSALQQNFINNNANIFQNIDNNSDSSLAHASQARNLHEEAVTCILCQENQNLTGKLSSMVCAAFVQKSTVLRKKTADLFTFFGVNIGKPVHVNTCGHFMHLSCWKEYLQTMYFEETRRPFRLRQLLAYDITRNEYLCPLCKCLSNSILPVLPQIAYKHSEMEFTSLSKELFSKDSCTLSPLDENTENDPVENISNDTFKRKVLTCPLKERLPQNAPVDSACSSEVESSSIEVVESEILSNENITTVEIFTASLNQASEIIPSFAMERTYLVWHSCAYTISSIEKYLSFAGKPLLDAYTYRQETCLRTLVNLSATLSRVNKDRLIKSKFTRYSFFDLSSSQEADCPNVLEWDCLDLVIFLMLKPSSVGNSNTPNLGFFDKNVYRLSLILHIAQNILEKDINSVLFLESDDTTSKDTECLARIIRLFKNCRGVNTIELWKLFKTFSLPFLRCCAIWHYFLTRSKPLQELVEPGGDTFENILDFLEIPSDCKELLGCSLVYDMFKKWFENPRVEDFRNNNPNITTYRKLIELPYDYCELINSASLFSCPNSRREDTRNPTMCLVCGTLLCGDMYCCQKELDKALVGSCTFHSHYCSDGSGMFLRIRECQILLLSSSPSRGCFIPAPYFDEYGEADQGLFRGNPLHLSDNQYDELQKLWLSNAIQEEISRAIESSHGFSSTQWSLL